MANYDQRSAALAATKAGWITALETVRDTLTDNTDDSEWRVLMSSFKNPCGRSLCNLYHGVNQPIKKWVCKNTCDIYNDCQADGNVRTRFLNALREFPVTRQAQPVIDLANEFLTACADATLREDA